MIWSFLMPVRLTRFCVFDFSLFCLLFFSWFLTPTPPPPPQVLMWSRFRFKGEKSRKSQHKSGSVIQATSSADLWTEDPEPGHAKFRNAQFVVFRTFKGVTEGLSDVLNKMKEAEKETKNEGEGGSVLILTLVDMDADFKDEDTTSGLLSKFLQERKEELLAANVGRVTVALNHPGSPVDYFTFFSRFFSFFFSLFSYCFGLGILPHTFFLIEAEGLLRTTC